MLHCRGHPGLGDGRGGPESAPSGDSDMVGRDLGRLGGLGGGPPVSASRGDSNMGEGLEGGTPCAYPKR